MDIVVNILLNSHVPALRVIGGIYVRWAQGYDKVMALMGEWVRIQGGFKIWMGLRIG